MKILKKIFKAILATTLVASFAFTAACSNVDGSKKPSGSGSGDGGNPSVTPGGEGGNPSVNPGGEGGNPSVNPGTTRLSAPQIALSENVLSWNAVSNATAYKIYMNEAEETSVTQTSYSIPHSEAGTYVYKVKATSSDANYSDSEFSNSVSYIVSNGGVITPPIVDPEVERYTVSFDTAGGSKVEAQIVAEGATATKPTNPTLLGKQFVAWYTEAALSNEYNFKAPVTEDITLYAKWAPLPVELKEVKAYNEALAVSWAETIPAQAKVEYCAVGGDTWTEIDNELIRLVSSNVARADIVGLKAGSYNVRITTSTNTEINVPSPVQVEAHDRSGYAHFNYTEGVGAYKDDGTLKDNALVIYVTEANKDTVMDQVCAENADINMFRIPTYAGTPGKDWGGKNASGIGWWMNNAQYTANNANSSHNKRPSNTYDPVNGAKLGFGSVNRPIVIRVIGKVTTPEGLTPYDSEDEGGIVGDNGHMARMRNLKNVTIEGIGEDAVIEGWGVHFIAGSNENGCGKSFEVRNLTFDKYPEDAIGMEGQQSGGKLTAPVERCWIHNNTFLPGYCANPTESDKSEGDGSCDFKRGEYYTLSYNYFTDCHKTNLVGGGDDHLQYNVTMHHNWWHNIESRIPLARKANIHFYNNYVSTDPTAIAISYVHSIRANSYIFSEGNYYLGCKNVADKGPSKSWNNTFLGCSGSNTFVNVTSREEAVSNSCTHYNGTDLSKFDTDPTLFYYDTATKTSKCLLDDSVTARLKAIQHAGCFGWSTNNPDKQGSSQTAAVKENMADTIPTDTVPVPDEGVLNVDFSAPPKGVVLNGKVNSGAFKSNKGDGQFVIFRLSASAKVTVSAPSDTNGYPYLVSENGKLMAVIENNVTVELKAGTYMIIVSLYGYEVKQSSISALSFESGAGASQERIEAAKAAINALPAASDIALSDKSLIEAAKSAYSALSASEIATLGTDLATKYSDCVNAYNTISVNDVIAKINAIGTVTKDSYNAINAAQTAYDGLDSALRGQVTNYGTLQAAWTAYANYAVSNVVDMINALVDTSTLNVSDQSAISSARTAYDEADAAYKALDSAQQAQVTNVNKLNTGLTNLTQLEKLFTFKQDLAAFNGTTVDGTNLTAANALKALYTSLTSAQQGALTSNEVTKYNALVASLTEFAKKAQDCTFEGSISNESFLSASRGGKAINYKSESLTINATGKTYSKGMKIESNMVITITATTKSTVKFYVNASGSFKYNGKNVSTEAVNGDNVITVTIEAGTHTFERVTGFNLYYVTLTPAA